MALVNQHCGSIKSPSVELRHESLDVTSASSLSQSVKKHAIDTCDATFVTGSIHRHVLIMTLTGAIGLMTMFLVDFADLYFLSLLGKTEITAAIGYAGMFSFASMSISIGIAIAGTALVAKNLGAGAIANARRYATSTLILATVFPLLTAMFILFYANETLAVLGAKGLSQAYAAIYMRTVAFGLPFLGAALCISFILRAIGDPKRAMYVTLTAAAINGILDPILILGFDLSMQGAALATVSANIVSFAFGFHALNIVHTFPAAVTVRQWIIDLKPISAIALPAAMTQLATPFAIGYLTWASSQFGDEAVAGMAVVNRLVPVAFSIVFALSGAVGPIIGQNYGAQNFPRLRQTIHSSLMLNIVYISMVSVILFLLKDSIPTWFKAKGDAVTLITLFCAYIAITWIFAGGQFVAQAAFNTLGQPMVSMWLNWGKATIGTIPFVILATKMWGFKGIIIGYSLGTVVFGIISIVSIYWYISKLEHQGKQI